ARARWPDADRIAWIRKDRWLGFPKAEAVRKTLDAMLRYPPRTRMPCLLIYGQTGLGKSRIVERFEAENPRGFNEATGVATIPV
ncbi:TniB family NTP-binding protein, partial [Pandoraea pneumonica]|uniref:TniB family NTP-binding protein n=1 Tax=Pandoraea pneumonica TaxID=2508299 RepID=UPI003CF57FFB